MSWTSSKTSYQKIAKQRDRDENMWEKYKEKVHTENIHINLRNFEKTEKKQINRGK